MGKGDIRPRGQRQLRVGELIRHALAQSLDRGEARDPGLANAPITATEVRVSPDLRNATAFVMPLGGGDAADILQSLNRAAPFFRRRIGEEVDLRRLPNISFELDSSFDNAAHIDELLRRPSVSADIHAADDSVNNPSKDGA